METIPLSGEPAVRAPASTHGRVACYFAFVDEQGFEIVSEIVAVEIIAVGGNIRDLRRLAKLFGSGRWRKLKGIATVRLQTGRVRRAELHWYEAHGIDKKEFKIKRYLD